MGNEQWSYCACADSCHKSCLRPWSGVYTLAKLLKLLLLLIVETELKCTWLFYVKLIVQGEIIVQFHRAIVGMAMILLVGFQQDAAIQRAHQASGFNGHTNGSAGLCEMDGASVSHTSD